MKTLDERGIAALEFTFVAVPLFTLMFVIFDFGRYAITMQSLRALANAEARAIMIGCYTHDVTSNPKVSPDGCTADPLTTAAKQAVAPFLYVGDLAPTVSITASANALTITATHSGFAMMMPLWGTSLNAPSASATIPY